MYLLLLLLLCLARLLRRLLLLLLLLRLPRLLLLLRQINVDVTDAGPRFGRVVTAREPVIRGDLLASIPLNLVWYPSTPPGSRGGTQVHCAMLGAACSAWFRVFFCRYTAAHGGPVLQLGGIHTHVSQRARAWLHGTKCAGCTLPAAAGRSSTPLGCDGGRALPVPALL